MRKRQLQKLIENELYDIAYDIGFQILDRLEDDEEIDEWQFDDMLTEELDSWFTYYCDAWEYLQDNNITDFEEAVNEWGVYDVCGIAMYYARDSISHEVSCWWDTYETEPVEDEEDEDIE